MISLKLETKAHELSIQEQELLQFIVPIDNYTISQSSEDEVYRQTYTRINATKLTINAKIANLERNYSVLYILKIKGADLTLTSLTEFNDTCIVEYEAGYVFVRLPEKNKKAIWQYMYGDYISTECTSEFSEMVINGVLESVLIVTRTYKATDISVVNEIGESLVEKEIYVAGKGRILTYNE